MNHLKTLLVANRGEIACRLVAAASKLGIRTIAIYTSSDSESAHVSEADEAVLLQGDARSAYLDGDQIIAIAKSQGAQAIIPGYGFLSENMAFARDVAAAGLIFVGPSPEAIESFGLKHTARDLAVAAGIPIVPGSDGLIGTEEAAVQVAEQLGFPVMLKATAGGGGMGLMTCSNKAEVSRNFQSAQSRGASLFKNSGVFLERYYPNSHHVEVQVFGNGQGKAISIGERECSIQRRHQKVIEECPSPFVSQRFPELRARLVQAAVSLAESIRYSSAGTIEYLVDDLSGDWFFLEMNTRLQVEHGITEMCYNIDIVELMLQQADYELGGLGGIPAEKLHARQAHCLVPTGHAIEARVYAENPARNFAPSPGLLQDVSWHVLPGTRIDTWIKAGITVSPDYDPLLGKVMFHGPTRDDAVANITEVLKKSIICGPPVNLDYLSAIVSNSQFLKGHTITKFLETLDYAPAGIDVISGGSYTLVEDFPGRPSVGHGFGHAGPMDPIAFQAANIIVGNPVGTEGLEITLVGPELRFLGDAIIALCGPPVPVTLDGQNVSGSGWTRVFVRAGQCLKIGKLAAHCRVYMAVYGGFPNISKWFGSKSTNPLVGVGGYQGRPLRAGDYLTIVERSALPAAYTSPLCIPHQIIPQYTTHWDIQVMPGPYETGYLTTKDIDMCFSTTWKVSHNAARGGIRLLGPRPGFTRSDGGDGGSHPSNVYEYGYPIGGINWTGDEPVLFPVDCPDFGGFICTQTCIKADAWKIGQLRAGDTVQFHRVSLDRALQCRQENNFFLQQLTSCLRSGSWDAAIPFGSRSRTIITPLPPAPNQDILASLDATESRPKVTYRAGADDYLLIEYGTGKADLELKCRATALKRKLESSPDLTTAIYNIVACGNSLALWYDGLRLPQADLVTRLLDHEASIGEMQSLMVPNRRFRLPVTFQHKKLRETIDRYTVNQRSLAAYLPDPFRYVAEVNGMTTQELKDLFLAFENVIIAVGFIMAVPQGVPRDPRHRIRTPKMNPSRTYTPGGCFACGGTAMSVYQVDSPGGYMPMGMSLPTLDVYGSKPGFEKPWLIQDMDIVTYYEVTEEEYNARWAEFRAGRYRFEFEDGVFDVAEYKRLLQETEAEVNAMRQKKDLAQRKMAEREQVLFEEWLAQKASVVPDDNKIQAMLEDPTIQAIEAPSNANVWKILIEEGDIIKDHQVVVILEAMKMEINVVADPELVGAKVEKVLVKSGVGVESGRPVVLVRRPAQ